MKLDNNTMLQGGKFRILSSLGQQGGFGITYLASQTGLEREVVVKEFFIKGFCTRSASSLCVPVADKADFFERYKNKFLDEARIIAALNHPNIVKIIDVFEENGTAYYVMEYHSNGSLGSIVKNEGVMSEERALRYISQIASALDAVHSKRITHLDVKPDNILLSVRDEAILIDFGVSRYYDDNGKGNKTNTVVLSYGYSPIELYSSDGVAEFYPSTDVYSLGATLYKILSGETPPEPSKMVNSDHIKEQLEKRNISGRTIAAIVKAMSFYKEERPQSMVEFLNLFNASVPTVVINADTEDSTVPACDDTKNATVIVCDSADAQFKEGAKAYYSGDYVAAVECYTKAAEQGHVKAQYFLGSCCEKGVGTVKNNIAAVKWYRKAAEQNYSKAHYKLGQCYEFGIGVAIDAAEALQCYRKASERRHSDVQRRMAHCYENGVGVAKNMLEALKWYRIAAEQTSPVARINSGVSVKNAESTLLTKGFEIFKAGDYAEALKIWQQAAEQGDAIAMYNVGACYYNGYGVAKDYNTAVKWWRKAAKLGDRRAQYYLGSCYYYGEGVLVNIDEAIMWYTKSAEQGYADAQFRLGCCYAQGDAASNDATQLLNISSERMSKIEAVKWWRKAAEQKFADAEFILSTCYFCGEGVATNFTEAIKWCRKAAKQACLVAQLYLANCYLNGIGVVKNIDEAALWYTKAAEQGDVVAKEILQRNVELARYIRSKRNNRAVVSDNAEQGAVEGVDNSNVARSNKSVLKAVAIAVVSFIVIALCVNSCLG